LYFSANTVRVAKSPGIRWAGFVARIAEKTGVCVTLVAAPGETRPPGRWRWENKLKWILKKLNGKAWT